MKFIQFNDKKIDSFLFMELSDLAKTLTRLKNAEVEFAYRSYYDPLKNKVYVSHFWDNRPNKEKVNGLKSDVFLRSIGSRKYTDFQAVASFLKDVKKYSIQSFAKQLFMMFEDLRIEELCKKERPGTKKAFAMRKRVLRRHFKDQLNVNLVKSVHTDALFCAIFLIVTSETPLEDIPTIHQEIDMIVPFIRNEVSKVFDAKHTKDIVKLVLQVTDVLDEVLPSDMLNMYFHLPELHYEEVNETITFDEMKRINKLNNDDILENEKKDERDLHQDKLPTWHRETSKPTKSFLQFDLEQGTKTNFIGDDAREGDAYDQALAVVQGSSRNSDRNEYSKMEAIANIKTVKEGKGTNRYGKENKYAVPIFIKPKYPSMEEILAYENYKNIVSPYQKKLKQTIQKTLEHKKIQPRGDLHFGRLNKKLVRLWTDEQPRLFYKKQQPSPQIDAVFALLVDCSASMSDKMDQTKLGITLFHEALKSLLIPHLIVGFWEDTNEATKTKQPNYFNTVIDFPFSLKQKSGPEIIQLEPKEDNRDGFAIRIISEKLLKRSEKQKFLLVFSDGEPAAFGYDQNGIVDTHEAVITARKQGIEVINVFLANGEIDENQQKTIQNIYGKYSILVPNIDDLPDVLFPLLKRLIYKTL
jgi:nitric oxide reductase activation protein